MSTIPDESVRAGNQAQSELHDYLHARDERRKLFPKAILVGFVAGLVAVAFRACLGWGDALRNIVAAFAVVHPGWGPLLLILFCSAGTVGSILVVRKWAPETSGSGIPHLEAVLHRHRTLRWARVLPAKFIGGVLAIGSGLALGREGPTVQMGGSAGAGVAKLLRVSTRETLILTAAGAGAGLAAAFNAPLAGLIFVLEELQRDFRPTVFGAAFLAAAAADVVTRLFAGQVAVFQVPAYPAPPLAFLPIFAIVGVAAGVLGVGFNRGLLRSLNVFAALHARRRYWAAGIVGVVVGIVAYISPISVGGGHSLAELALAGKVTLLSIPAFFLVRFVLTMGSYGSGAPGGIFAPLLALGALLGLGIGAITVNLFPQFAVHPGVFAVVGMAAYFTSIVRAPLTGIVLIIEMTASYALMLPLLIACFCAYAVAEAMGDLPIYESLLQRDLLAGGTDLNLDEPMVLEVEVEPGSPFEGTAVKDLGLPPGVVLVRCRERDREWVPTAATVLHAHQRVTAVISPDSEDGVGVLRAGTSEKPMSDER